MMVLLESKQKLQPGDPLPQFTLRNIDDAKVTSTAFAGSPVVVIFMCNHCPYVKPKMQEIADMQNEYASQGVVVICINSNDPVNYPEDNFASMQQIAKKFGYTYYLFDQTQDVARAFGAVCTPDPFVFDASHYLVYHGRINNAMQPHDTPTQHDLQEVLDKLLAEKPIHPWFVPSMGCSIKWK